MLYINETLLTVLRVSNLADACMHVHANVYTHARTRSRQRAHTRTHIHTTQVEHQRRSPWVPWGQFPLLPMGYLSLSRSAPPSPGLPPSCARTLSHSLSAPPSLLHICICQSV